MDSCHFHGLPGPVPRDSDFDSSDLYGSVAEDVDVFDSASTASATSAATSTAGRAGDSQTGAALDGRWKAGSAKAIPKDLKTIKEEPEPDMGGMAGGVPGGVAGGSAGGVLGGVIGGAGGAPPPPKITPKRVTVGGNVQAARLVNRVQPLYPPLRGRRASAAP